MTTLTIGMDSAKEFYLVRRKFIIKLVIWSLVAWGIAFNLAGSFASKYRIGLDLNEVRCLPWRVYFITFGRGPYLKDQYVVFRSENGLMGPKFEGHLIGKKVAAVEGDRVVIKRDVLYVNNHQIGPLLLLERLKVPSGHFDRDDIVPKGKLLAIGTEPRSYDGRYWGFLDTNAVIGWVDPVF